MSSGFGLSIDFGTSNTVAVLRWPDGRVRPLLFDGSPVLSSAVCLTPGRRILVGADAHSAAGSAPEGFEPTPKRCIDESVVLLAGTELGVAEVIGSVLRRVADEARRTAGLDVDDVVLTYPAAWGRRRREVLLAAAAGVGLGSPRLVPEPVAAAAAHVLATAGAGLPVGRAVLVYDLGAGTFDAAVVRRDGTGCTVLGCAGLTDAGGLDVDAALVAHLGRACADSDPAAWQRLVAPRSPADRRARRQLWDDVRAAKETLSRTATANVHVPLLDRDVPVGREQFDQLARPILARTVAASRAALDTAGVPAAELAGVVLVGGSSRIPLAATLLHQALGIAPTIGEQPELVVAEGALAAAGIDAATAGTDHATAGTDHAAAGTDHAATAGAGLAGATPSIDPATPPRRRVRVAAAVAASVALLVALTLTLTAQRGGADASAGARGPSTPGTREPNGHPGSGPGGPQTAGTAVAGMPLQSGVPLPSGASPTAGDPPGTARTAPSGGTPGTTPGQAPEAGGPAVPDPEPTPAPGPVVTQFEAESLSLSSTATCSVQRDGQWSSGAMRQCRVSLPYMGSGGFSAAFEIDVAVAGSYEIWVMPSAANGGRTQLQLDGFTIGPSYRPAAVASRLTPVSHGRQQLTAGRHVVSIVVSCTYPEDVTWCAGGVDYFKLVP